MKMAENGGRSWRRITRRLFYSSSSSSISSSFGNLFFGKGFLGFFALLLSLELICSIVSFDFFFFFLIRIYPKFRGEKCIRTRFWGRIFF